MRAAFYSSPLKIESIEISALISAIIPKKFNLNPDTGIYFYGMNSNSHQITVLVIGMF